MRWAEHIYNNASLITVLLMSKVPVCLCSQRGLEPPDRVGEGATAAGSTLQEFNNKLQPKQALEGL